MCSIFHKSAHWGIGSNAMRWDMYLSVLYLYIYIYIYIYIRQCCEGTAEEPLLTFRENNPLLLIVIFNPGLRFYTLAPLLGRGATPCKMLEAKVQKTNNLEREPFKKSVLFVIPINMA